MESITSRIKQSAQTVSAPEHLKQRVMNAVTNLPTERTLHVAPPTTTASPYAIILGKANRFLIGAFCLLIATGSYSLLRSTPTETTDPLLAIADTIITDVSSDHNESIYYIESFNVEFETVSMLLSETDQVSTNTTTLTV